MTFKATSRIAGAALLAAGTLLTASINAANADTVLGAVYPAPGGNGFSTVSGTDPAFDTKTVQYTINNPAAFSQLWWAPAGISASMNGVHDSNFMTSVQIVGATATWHGSTTVTNEFGSTITILTEFVATIQSGASGWDQSLSLATPTTSLSPLAFAHITSGTFTLSEQF